MAEMAPPGAVTTDREGEVWILTLVGEHCLSTVHELRITLDSLLDPDAIPVSRPTLVAIDLTQASFFDSSVLSAIVRAHDMTVDDPEAELVVIVEHEDTFAARLLEKVGLSDVMPTYASRACAVAALTQSAGSI